MSSLAPPVTEWGLFATPSALADVTGFEVQTVPGQTAKRICLGE
jgi:hypothetical protein